MKKQVYIQPETNVCKVEATQMMALSKMEGPADPMLEVLENEEKFSDIWGN